MKAATLKGTKQGYEIILDATASVDSIVAELRKLLAQLGQEHPQKRLGLRIVSNSRLLSDAQKNRIRRIFNSYDNIEVDEFDCDVITKLAAEKIKEEEAVHVLAQIIRNGQVVQLHGDVLFLGSIHEGGKLITDGNVYVFGSVYGIVQAGAPNSEGCLIVGDLHNAQQLRIGEQFDIMADKQIESSAQSVAYVNDLHILDYGKIKELKQINPKFYNRIGGVL